MREEEVAAYFIENLDFLVFIMTVIYGVFWAEQGSRMINRLTWLWEYNYEIGACERIIL